MIRDPLDVLAQLLLARLSPTPGPAHLSACPRCGTSHAESTEWCKPCERKRAAVALLQASMAKDPCGSRGCYTAAINPGGATYCVRCGDQIFDLDMKTHHESRARTAEACVWIKDLRAAQDARKTGT